MLSNSFKRHCGFVGIDVNEFVNLSFYDVRAAVFDHLFNSANVNN